MKNITKYISFSREEYLKRAADRRQKVYDMRIAGATWQEIAKVMNKNYNAVRSLYYQHLRGLKECD